MDDFLAPQPFNVVIGPEPDVTPRGSLPSVVAEVNVPNVPQEITEDRDLYPPRGRGVRNGVVR